MDQNKDVVYLWGELNISLNFIEYLFFWIEVPDLDSDCFFFSSDASNSLILKNRHLDSRIEM